ncbi:sulfite exporter TauE/SafE family protein [Winogradskyella sediminis]|uniref:Probable membrane transporter protein n=1 Tax=Winogradskyella sediminis TaxID=1382466 RepID=A0A1H1R5X7_9FLAO|nr:sulfite exporter TauE/SafE family protein [Winogradskyella sediminis]SDS31132.1 hypothetical protein SAMN04489797_1326 [Winogradskyella sediminis]
MSYLEILQSYNLTVLHWLAIGAAVFILGLSKSGIKGIGIILIVILAFVFGEKASTGILLPMLICADILAVIYYNRHADWAVIKKLMPWIVIGILIGVWIGNDISEYVFKKLMAIIILVSVGLMFYLEKRKSKDLPTHKLFSIGMGLLTGFTTMIGNLAGPVSNIYFLTMRFPKNEFIGTAAWIFFIANLIKLPFHIFIWETVTVETLALNSVLIPAVLLGFLLGTSVVKRISNVNYRHFILIATANGGIVMLFR